MPHHVRRPQVRVPLGRRRKSEEAARVLRACVRSRFGAAQLPVDPEHRYVLHLMEWVESQLDDGAVFPQQPGEAFPASFRETVKTIFKRLFRVYAHIYHSHWDLMVSLGAGAQLVASTLLSSARSPPPCSRPEPWLVCRGAPEHVLQALPVLHPGV